MAKRKEYLLHRAFGRVQILKTRVTAAGNRVVLGRLSNGTVKTLLADKKYWTDVQAVAARRF